MRISKVIGKVTLNQKLAEVLPGSYLLVVPLDRACLAGRKDEGEETIVAYDTLGAREGDRIGLVEGREAAVPFHPEKHPYDGYCACILDSVSFKPVLEVK
jgi:microcompartment protein CcmK/EutM